MMVVKTARLFLSSSILITLYLLLPAFPGITPAIAPPPPSHDNPESSRASINQVLATADLTPTNIKLDRIRLNAPITRSGKTPDGRPEVPPDHATAGWWQYGAKPGESGNAVLAGHFKIADGSPGVFYHLNQVKLGDQFTVTAADTTVQTFTVVDLGIYTVADFPLQKIYGSKDAKRLNLVTCTGTFLPEKNDYTHRLVVYASLDE
jgi:LPXTG-site transpeptidase (sortase) family protein